MTDFRPIDITALPPATLREQPAPMLDWVKIAQLRIDDSYQRPLTAQNWQAIRQIAENFDWCAFGPILCAPIEGGLYVVIDVQHRAHAAALCGIASIPAMIVPVSRQRQALAFVQVNSGIRVTAHQTYRAELAAGQPEALAMQAAVAAGGCELLTYNPSASTRKPRQISAIGFVRAAVRRGWGPHLTTALLAMTSYDTRGRYGLYSDYVLKPLTQAIAQTAGTDWPLVLAALQRRDPFHVLEAATNWAIGAGKSVATARADAFARQIAQAKDAAA